MNTPIPPGSAPAPPSGNRPVELTLCLLAIALAVLASRAIFFGDPVADIDEQIYSFIGWRMQFGELPYVDWWDRKPFGLFLIYGFAHFVGGEGPAAYQILAALAAFAGALLVFALARPLVDRVSATFAAILYALLLCAYAVYSGQSEVFHVPLVLAMLLLVRDPDHPRAVRRALLAMALGGIALQVKYTVLPQCLFLGAWALLGQWRRGMAAPRLAGLAACFAALGMAPTIAVGLFYAALGHWDVYWYANFVSFFERGPSAEGRYHPLHRIWLAPVGLLIALGLYAAFRLAPPRNPRLYWLYAGAFLAALATVYLPSTTYQYYFAALVPGAILLALPLLDRSGPQNIIPGVLLIALAGWLLQVPTRYSESQANRAEFAEFSARISAATGLDRCLFIYEGPPILYRTAGRCVPTRYAYPDHLSNPLETNALDVNSAEETARILASRPGVILLSHKWMFGRRASDNSNPNLVQVRQALRADYEFFVEITLHDHRVSAWRLRDQGAPSIAM